MSQKLSIGSKLQMSWSCTPSLHSLCEQKCSKEAGKSEKKTEEEQLL